MTMKIEVTVPEAEIQGGGAAHYLAAAMSAIGFSRGVTLPMPLLAQSAAYEEAARNAATYGTGVVTADPLNETYAAVDPKAFVPTEAPKRERGKPSQGRARRTKEEIAEDEAAEAAEAAQAAQAAQAEVAAETSAVLAHDDPTRAAQIADAVQKANISSGEERIDPTTEADAKQDAADEAVEAEATKPAELTHDDVRAALQKYLTAYGTPAAMEDGPKVLTMMFGAEVTKVSAVPADQASLGKAVAGIDEMLVKNPFKREAQL